MSDDTKTFETLREMAKLTLLTNKINAIQEKNLRAFPKVFFEGVSNGIVDYDFSTPSMVDTEEDKKNLELKYLFKGVDNKNLRVTYRLTIDETIEQTHIDKRFQALENSVRQLFYNDTKVEVFFNGKKAFESKPNE